MILNEKRYAEILIKTGKIRKGKEFVDLMILGKYYLNIEQLNIVKVHELLLDFSNKNWKYDVLEKKTMILNQVLITIQKADLFVADKITFNQSEIDHILELSNTDLQNLMFTLMTLMKVQNNIGNKHIDDMQKELEVELNINKNKKKINELEKKLSKRKKDSNIFFDKSRKQVDTFTHCNLSNMTIKNKQALLRDLIVLGYIKINTIKNNTKLIAIMPIEVCNDMCVLKINCSPNSNDEYDLYNFQYIWNEIILQQKTYYCGNCFTKINKKSNAEKYCKWCAKKIDRDNTKKRVEKHREVKNVTE